MRIVIPDQTAKIDSGIELFTFRRVVFVQDKAHIGDHPQQITFVPFVQHDRLFVVGGQ